MAKRTAALVVALVTLWATPVGASEALWPCEVTVWIEDGARLPAIAEAALSQLDAATAISWPIVEDQADAMVTVDWADLDGGGLANVAASDVEKVWATVEVDPSISNRWAMYTFLHEFAHVAGLDHNDEVSVMGGRDVPFRKYTAWDLDALGDVACSG